MGAVTKIYYDADLVGVHPSTLTGSSYKMDHNAYSVVVNLSGDLLTALNAQKGSGTLVYRFDVYDAAGSHIHTEEEPLSELESLEFEITKRLTRFAGNVKIIPVITSIDGELTIFERRLGIITITVKATPESEEEEYEEVISLSTIEHAAKEAAAVALAAKGICLEAQEATEAARTALENGTTIIFDGGNAQSNLPINLVVDNFISQLGQNPVTSAAIAAALVLFETNIKSWVNNTYSMPALMAAVKQEIYAEEYPVGSVKVSFDPEYDPNGILPGTWVLLAAGVTIISAGTVVEDEEEFVFEVGDSGGEVTHKLDTEEIPKLTIVSDSPGNPILSEASSGIYSPELGIWPSGGFTTGNTRAYTFSTNSGDQPHNNMQPYIVANIWRRVEDETEE